MGRIYTQPQIGPASIDWNNPITRGLVSAPNFGTMYDAATGLPCSASGSVSKIVTPAGVGQYCTGGAYVKATVPLATGSIPPGVSVFVLHVPVSFVSYGALFRRSAAAMNLSVSTDGSGNINYRGINGNTGGLPTGTPALVANRVNSFAYVASSANADLFYANGIPSTAAGYYATSGTQSDSEMWFGAGGGGYSSSDNIYIAAFVFNRELRADEVVSLHRYPWQIFKAPTRFYFAPSGGGDGVLAETLTFSETYGAFVSLSAGLSESATFVDSQSLAITATAAQAESASHVETLSALRATTAALSETTTSVDTPSATLLTPAAQAETTSSVDTVSSAMTAVSSQAETFTSVDTQSGILSTLGTIAETITAAAAQDGSVSGALLGAIAETVTASDTVAANIQTLAAIVEAISALETLASNVATTSAISEIFSTVDSSSTGAILSGGVSETLSVVDSLATIRTLLAATAESLSSVDSQNANVSGSVQAIVESATVIDAAFAVLFTSAAVQETTALADIQYGYVNATTALARLIFSLPKETRRLILDKKDIG